MVVLEMMLKMIKMMRPFCVLIGLKECNRTRGPELFYVTKPQYEALGLRLSAYLYALLYTEVHWHGRERTVRTYV